MQQVDGLTPLSIYLTQPRDTLKATSVLVAKVLIDSYYKSAAGRKEVENDRTEEADKVSVRITEILAEKTFFTPAQRPPFTVGCLRAFTSKLAESYSISPKTSGCCGKTVYYASADTISETLDYDMGQERTFDYANLNVDDAISHLARFYANIWQIHPFL